MTNHPFSLIDTHAHLNLCQKPVKDIIKNAKEKSVKAIITVGINLESSLEGYTLSQQYPMVFPTLGIHPCETKNPPSLEIMTQYLDTYDFKAIGEIGLDYHHEPYCKETQHTWFRQQLDIAKQYKLPVIIHNRKADNDIVSIVKDYPTVYKVFHCFSGSPDLVKTLLSDYHFFSFTGTITYSKKGKTLRAIDALPLDKIMVETDCPYLTPAPYKGNENQPAYLPPIAQRVAEIKQLPLEKVCQTTTSTANLFFNLPQF